MNLSALAPWLAFAVSVVIFITSSFILALGRVSVPRPKRRPEPAEETPSERMPAHVEQRYSIPLSRALVTGSTLAAFFSVEIAVTAGSQGVPIVTTVVVGVAVAAALLVWQAFVTWFAGHGLARIAGPLWFVSGVLDLVGRRTLAHLQLGPGRGGDGRQARSTEDALQESLSVLQAAGISTGPGEARMIRAILDMDTARVREVMRPRVDMIAAPADSDIDEIVRLMTEEGHSRVPIYGENIDDVIGIVHAQDLLRARSFARNGAMPSAREIARQAWFVPESQRLDQLLREFQRARTQLVIVVDEYGGVSGLVTVQDLIEEIVGELVDEFDQDEPDIVRVSEDEVLMDARTPLDSLTEEFGVDVDSEGFDTLGGLIYRELGKMPSVDDSVTVGGLRMTVESTMGRRIRMVRVKRIAVSQAESSLVERAS